MWKETYTHQKRPVKIKRDLYVSNESYVRHVCGKKTFVKRKRPMLIKRDKFISKEIWMY